METPPLHPASGHETPRQDTPAASRDRHHHCQRSVRQPAAVTAATAGIANANTATHTSALHASFRHTHPHIKLLNVCRSLQRLERSRPNRRIYILGRHRPQARAAHLNPPAPVPAASRPAPAPLNSCPASTPRAAASRTRWSCATYGCKPSSAANRTCGTLVVQQRPRQRRPNPARLPVGAVARIAIALVPNLAFVRQQRHRAHVNIVARRQLRPQHQQRANLRIIQRPLHRFRHHAVVLHLDSIGELPICEIPLTLAIAPCVEFDRITGVGSFGACATWYRVSMLPAQKTQVPISSVVNAGARLHRPHPAKEIRHASVSPKRSSRHRIQRLIQPHPCRCQQVRRRLRHRVRPQHFVQRPQTHSTRAGTPRSRPRAAPSANCASSASSP